MRISLIEAQRLLESGQVVSLPTETVYGLAALLTHPQAIDAIFKLKGRPNNNPLIIHISNLNQIYDFAQKIPEGFDLLTKAFWPGPLTLVINIKENLIPYQARAGLSTAAFRIPNHPLSLEIISKCGPLVMPSANLSGTPSSTSPGHVEEDFGDHFPVIDGGTCQKGLESTILLHDQNRWKVIRLGALAPETFNSVLGYVPDIVGLKRGDEPLCPGQLHRHYAPKAKLTLTTFFPQELKGFVLGFHDVTYPVNCKVIAMGSINQPQSVAENLYATLRLIDSQGIEQVFVDIRLPKEGLWVTISERLQKAANL